MTRKSKTTADKVTEVTKRVLGREGRLENLETTLTFSRGFWVKEVTVASIFAPACGEYIVVSRGRYALPRQGDRYFNTLDMSKPSRVYEAHFKLVEGCKVIAYKKEPHYP